ncbi:MAG: DUF4474 domain-containing protein [Pseudomonadota bacterium]
MLQFPQGTGIYPWLAVILIMVLALGLVFYLPVKTWIEELKKKARENNKDIYEIIKDAGYSYDPEQDIFYSLMYPWQRKLGYCRLYDEASAPMNMIIDCEPVYFEYKGKRWLIEFWKGQYAMSAGGEIGVYTTMSPDLDVPGVFNGTFYECASDADRLYMSYYLFKNGRLLFKRKARHWWLTGFKLGEFADPSELSMYLTVALKDTEMRDAFIKGLMEAGYSPNELMVNDSLVSLVFDKPRTQQPLSRIPATDMLIQAKNKLLCDKFREITGQYSTFPARMEAIRKQAPELYAAALEIGKARRLYDVYEKIRDYLT